MPALCLSGTIQWFVFALVLGLGTTPVHGQLISVLGNGLEIEAGDSTPRLADHTDFGRVAVAAGVIDRTFTIRNVGIAPLRILPPQLLGGAAGEFTIPIAPAPVLPNGTQTVFTVRFNPALANVRRTNLRILSNASNDPIFDFAIQGFGVIPQPDINVQGNGLDIAAGDPVPRPDDHTDFGSIEVAAGPLTRTFTVQNLGDLGLSISSINFVDGGSRDFAFASVPAPALPPTFATTFEVTFDPSTPGLHRTTIRITSSDPDEGTYDFTIQGTGTSLAPELTLRGNSKVIASGDDTPSLDDHTRFENTRLGSGRSTRTFTIENTGNAHLTLTSIVTAGGHAADFTVPEFPTTPIPPGGTAAFQVHFDPSVFGLRNTTLRLGSNDPGTPRYEIALLGAGGTFELLRIERDGDDAIIHFTTNPDTGVSTYTYFVLFSDDLDRWEFLDSFTSPGGTTEQVRHVDGFTAPRRYWQVKELAQ